MMSTFEKYESFSSKEDAVKLCFHRRLPSRAGAIALSTLMAPAGAFAQGSPGSGGESSALEAVVVSGEKVRRELKDTASSVSVKAGKDLAKSVSTVIVEPGEAGRGHTVISLTIRVNP
jgi:hypothetical protein